MAPDPDNISGFSLSNDALQTRLLPLAFRLLHGTETDGNSFLYAPSLFPSLTTFLATASWVLRTYPHAQSEKNITGGISVRSRFSNAIIGYPNTNQAH